MSKDLKIGIKAKSFCLPNQEDKKVCLKDFKGKWVVLYFYPKDNTPGCTKEAVGFTEKKKEFDKLNAEIIGISPDSTERHKKFIEKHKIGITLLSDPEHKVIETYGAWQLKKMCGRECYGVVRSTFLISPEGKIAHIWPKVKVAGHVESVLDKIKELSK